MVNWVILVKYFLLFGLGCRCSSKALASDRSGPFQSQPWRAQSRKYFSSRGVNCFKCWKNGEHFLVSFNSRILNVETLGQLHYRFILFAAFAIRLNRTC